MNAGRVEPTHNVTRPGPDNKKSFPFITFRVYFTVGFERRARAGEAAVMLNDERSSDG